jgi:hypothetical protein
MHQKVMKLIMTIMGATCYMTFICGEVSTIDNQLLGDGELGIKDCNSHLFEQGG